MIGTERFGQDMRTLFVILLVTATLPAQVNPIDGSAAAVALGPGVAGNPESSVDVALNRSGDGVVVWRQRIATSPFNTYQLWAQNLRRGAPIGAAVPLAQTVDWFTTAELLSVKCAIDEFGNWAAVWDDTDQTNGNLVVYGRRWHAASSQLGPVTLVSDGAGNQHRWLPDVAMGRFGGSADPHWYVVWNYATQAGQSTIRMRRYRVNATGPTPIDVPSAVIDVNAEATMGIEGQDRPAIAIDDAGTLTIVWEKFGAWGIGSAYWRIMARRRASGVWLPINDPTAVGANPATGLDATDWEVSGLGDPAAPSNANTPPRVAVAADGTVLIAWKRNSGAPYGFRTLIPGPLPSTPATPGPLVAHLPQLWSPGHRRFDVALTHEGSFLLAWEHLATSVTSGRIMFSRIQPNGPSIEEFTCDPTSGVGVSSIAVAASDTGQVQVVWARGLGPGGQQAWRKPLDLAHFSLQSSPGPSSFKIALPGESQLLYQLWPMSAGGTPNEYALTAIGDGRAADASLLDPLLQWHLSQGGNHAILPLASSTLDVSGEATVNVFLPPGVGPISVTWALIIVDPARPWPAALRSYTQPRAIVVQ